MRIKLDTILFLFISILFVSCGDSHNNHYAIVLREKREAPKNKSNEEKIDGAWPSRAPALVGSLRSLLWWRERDLSHSHRHAG